MTADQPAERSPSGEECLLAGVAHLALFGGFFVIGPLAIYFWKRAESRFVAFHAAQAIVVSVLALAFGGVAAFALFPAMIAVGLGLSRASEVAAIAGVAALYLGLCLAGVLPFLLALIGAWRSFHGRWWSMPIVGRVAARMLDAPR